MFGYCGNCKYWGNKETFDAGYKKCTKIFDYEDPYSKGELAITIHSHYGSSNLITQPNFGCPLFEKLINDSRHKC